MPPLRIPLVLFLLATNAQAILLLDFEEFNGNLSVTAGGTFDVVSIGDFEPVSSVFIGDANSFAIVHPNGLVGGFGAFSSGDSPFAAPVDLGGAASGADAFGIEWFDGGLGVIYGPVSFSSGTAWDGLATWNGVTWGESEEKVAHSILACKRFTGRPPPFRSLGPLPPWLEHSR